MKIEISECESLWKILFVYFCGEFFLSNQKIQVLMQSKNLQKMSEFLDVLLE